MSSEQTDAGVRPVVTFRARWLELLLAASAIALVLQIVPIEPWAWSRRTWIVICLSGNTAFFAGALWLQTKLRDSPKLSRCVSGLEWLLVGVALALFVWIRPTAAITAMHALDARSWTRLTWFCFTSVVLFALIARRYCPDMMQTWAENRAAAAAERRKRREGEERRDRRLQSEELQRRRDQLHK
jgi:roadblock/LC7 domain-containing protein